MPFRLKLILTVLVVAPFMVIATFLSLIVNPLLLVPVWWFLWSLGGAFWFERKTSWTLGGLLLGLAMVSGMIWIFFDSATHTLRSAAGAGRLGLFLQGTLLLEVWLLTVYLLLNALSSKRCKAGAVREQLTRVEG